jgi:hypothetical protein
VWFFVLCLQHLKDMCDQAENTTAGGEFALDALLVGTKEVSLVRGAGSQLSSS